LTRDAERAWRHVGHVNRELAALRSFVLDVNTRIKSQHKPLCRVSATEIVVADHVEWMVQEFGMRAE